jgi:hypothetical protein
VTDNQFTEDDPQDEEAGIHVSSKTEMSSSTIVDGSGVRLHHAIE